MNTRIGCDIVHIPRFQASLKRGGTPFLEKLFTPRELDTAKDVYSLAGYFAAKEAIVKASSVHPGAWHSIEIHKESSGRPSAYIDRKPLPGDISVSHDGDYAFAVAIIFYAPHTSS